MRAVAGAARPIVLGRPAVLVAAHPAALVRMGVGVLGRSPISNAVSHAQRAVEGNTAVVGRSRSSVAQAQHRSVCRTPALSCEGCGNRGERRPRLLQRLVLRRARAGSHAPSRLAECPTAFTWFLAMLARSRDWRESPEGQRLVQRTPRRPGGSESEGAPAQRGRPTPEQDDHAPRTPRESDQP
jgi:hypothetical protein